VSCPKLRVSTNFIIFGPTDQKLWVFEVIGQGLVKAGMCWSQLARVDHLWRAWKKSGGHGKKIQKKKTVYPCPGIILELVGDQQSPASCGSTPGQVQTILFF
jgi:hypothetical protein